MEGVPGVGDPVHQNSYIVFVLQCEYDFEAAANVAMVMRDKVAAAGKDVSRVVNNFFDNGVRNDLLRRIR